MTREKLGELLREVLVETGEDNYVEKPVGFDTSICLDGWWDLGKVAEVFMAKVEEAKNNDM